MTVVLDVRGPGLREKGWLFTWPILGRSGAATDGHPSCEEDGRQAQGGAARQAVPRQAGRPRGAGSEGGRGAGLEGEGGGGCSVVVRRDAPGEGRGGAGRR